MDNSIGLVLSRLKEISSAVLSAAESVNLEVVLERIAELAKELANTKYAALGIPDGAGGLKYFKTAGLTAEQIAVIEHFPRGHGLLGAIMKERQIIRLDHLQHDRRSSGFPKNHPEMFSFLGIPIQTGQQLFGMLYLCDKLNDEPFNDLDILVIETMASYAALAIAGAEMTQQANHIQLLEERARIGMELHDGVIQSLYGIGMQVELLRLGDKVKNDDLLPIIENLNVVIEDIRRYILNLRERNNRSLSVRQILENITHKLVLPSALQVTINAPDQKPPFPSATFESICLIVNEALSNVVRHASATVIRMSAYQEDREFILSVEDDGKGFDPRQTGEYDGGGLGVRNMKQRARLNGGDLFIQSQPGKGTTLTIKVPIRGY